ncbi:hypothetical protein R84B8_02484 [Treponema sp. R8-4-B8]
MVSSELSMEAAIDLCRETAKSFLNWERVFCKFSDFGGEFS